MKINRRFLIPIVIISIIVLGNIFLKLYPNLLWFSSFGYSELWWFTLKTKVKVFSLFAGIAFLTLQTNLWLANRISRKLETEGENPRFSGPFDFINQLYQNYKNYKAQSSVYEFSAKTHQRFLKILVLILSLFLGIIGLGTWEALLQYLNPSTFNLNDPLFNRDISFYIFKLPFLQALYRWCSLLLIISIASAGWIYFTRNLLAFIVSKTPQKGFRLHLLGLISLFFFLLASGMILKMIALLYSTTGSVYGAGYTDVHGYLLGYRVIGIALAIQGFLTLLWAVGASPRLALFFFPLLLLSSLVLGKVYPGIIQSYVVAPNEIQKENQYIERNINFTRKAYNIDAVKEVNFPAENNLNKKDIKDNITVLNNIRLWNPIPLKQTFKQLQEIRLYYEFNAVDIDRYRVNGQLQQVMLSARELDTTQLAAQAQTWVNQRLIYTHGYGACLSPVNEVTPEGLPVFYVKDIPPVSNINLDLIRPEIYFGEKTNNFVITNTNQPEFNYPKGNSNAYNFYDGNGGIELNSFFRRLIYALKFSDIKVLISGYIKKESRLLYDRNIKAIVKTLTPFLFFDRDPYLVLGKDGRLYWFLDAYTSSNNFPYSEPYKGVINYIRNSVLVSIDAYSGETHYYIKDKTDPIIQSYANIYPKLFKDIEEMPRFLQEHSRYPKDLFKIQSELYSTYHMTDPQVFYNREDLWAIPSETYGETETRMEPYYIVMKVPGEEKNSYALMTPFTPTNKNNMIGWLSAKCDIQDFGKLNVFVLPKERTVFGPMQIESRIDQDTEISQKLTLWGQKGSRVIRGNLMVIPIKDSLIYAEPIYLQATQSKLPELKRVILSYGNNIVMTPTLGGAINSLFDSQLETTDSSLKKSTKKDSSLKGLVDKLVKEYQSFKQYSQKSDWTNFGKSLKKIDKTIEKIKLYRKNKEIKD